MKRMISPEVFQYRGCDNYEENFREHINTAQRENRKSASNEGSFKSETSLGRTVLRNYNSESDTLEDAVFEDNQSDKAINDNSVHGDIDKTEGSFGNISNQSSRRPGTTVPPTLDALKQSEISKERNTDNICECGRMHPPEEELRRRSTGSSPISYEEKHYYLGSGAEVSGDRRNSARHGKYSLVYDDIYVMEAMQCCRYRMRRNALCDPFRLPMPQKTREKLEKDNEKRKSSVTRKVSQFLTVRLDLNREEDLL